MSIFSKKILLTSVIGLSLLLSACGGEEAKKEDKKEKEFAIPVTIASIERNAISSNFHTTATLESRNEADIITRVTGIIEQLSVEEGDYVKKGQVLAIIDARRYKLTLDKADAELAGLDQELKRLASMTMKNLVSAQEADKLKYQQRAAVAARELAALDLQDSKIVAPMSGYISKRYVKTGHFTQGYQNLFHIVDSSSLQAIVYLPEHQLSNIKLNQQALLSFSARQNQVFPAKVRSISPVIESSSGTFKVILAIDNSHQQLKPGMFAQIALTFDKHEDVLTIPSDAIITLDNQSKIYIVKDNKAVEVLIEKGFVEDHFTEVKAENMTMALNEGDHVVVNGHHSLKADVLVEILNPTEKNETDVADENSSLKDEANKTSTATTLVKAG